MEIPAVIGHVSVARAICIVPRGEITGPFSVGVDGDVPVAVEFLKLAALPALSG